MKFITFIFALIFAFMCVFNLSAAQAENSSKQIVQSASFVSFNYTDFGQIPILHEGRIKPLDSFARIFLTSINAKDHVQGMNASTWMAELLFDREKAYKKEVFYIPNHDVLRAINIKPHETGHRYAFKDIIGNIGTHLDVILTLRDTDRSLLTPAQRQLVDLYIKSLWYLEISHSVSLIVPDMVVTNQELADAISISVNKPMTYLEMMRYRSTFVTLRESEPSNLLEKELSRLSTDMDILSRDRETRLFRIVPPKWQKDGELWQSPWQNIYNGSGSKQSAEYLLIWQDMARSYRMQDSHLWASSSAEAIKFSIIMSRQSASLERLSAEYFYNKASFFQVSLFLYLIAFITLLGSGLMMPALLKKVSLFSLSFGFIAHFMGLCLRMYIMARPPVTTLYESILFVGLVAVLFSIILELKSKNMMGLIIGSVLGCFLQFLGMKYAVDNNSMGMLAAVLDTNFWLGTHVVTITIGYGCCLVAGTLAHLYLLSAIFKPDNTEQRSVLLRNIVAVSLVALFFSILGTILGGIWADQSWGRFWGWDPKENGAMLICLWLICLLHGRIAQSIKPLTFVACMVGTNIVVSLAWFGVNLLQVGLHSYGFTQNIALNLGLFIGAEILFVMVCLSVIYYRQSKMKVA